MPRTRGVQEVLSLPVTIVLGAKIDQTTRSALPLLHLKSLARGESMRSLSGLLGLCRYSSPMDCSSNCAPQSLRLIPSDG
jgi:hypothetical protein